MEPRVLDLEDDRLCALLDDATDKCDHKSPVVVLEALNQDLLYVHLIIE